MIASSENNSFQFHGLGPAYHGDRGKLGFYLYTTTGKGPHGRGTGQVRSKQKLTLNEWHDTCIIKEEDRLHIEVDGIRNTVCLSDVGLENEEDFIMKPTGNITLHGKIKDFQIVLSNKYKSARK